jgi:two-component system nitrogen regulation response regulator NtrX
MLWGIPNMISIIIIDDDPEIRNMLSSVLEEEGYSIEAVGDGKSALKKCEKLPFDIALIDVELPDTKGTELLTQLKAIQPKMIRIVITGHPSIETAIKSVNERADGYLLKPFNMDNLREMIKKLTTEKTNEYLRMFTEVERAKKETPIFKYQHPDKW